MFNVLLYVTLCPFKYCNHLNGIQGINHTPVAIVVNVLLNHVPLG